MVLQMKAPTEDWQWQRGRHSEMFDHQRRVVKKRNQVEVEVGGQDG